MPSDSGWIQCLLFELSTPNVHRMSASKYYEEYPPTHINANQFRYTIKSNAFICIYYDIDYGDD